MYIYIYLFIFFHLFIYVLICVSLFNDTFLSELLVLY